MAEVDPIKTFCASRKKLKDTKLIIRKGYTFKFSLEIYIIDKIHRYIDNYILEYYINLKFYIKTPLSTREGIQ